MSVTKGLQYCQWGKQEEKAGNLASSLRLYREGLDMLRDAYIELSLGKGNEAKLEFLQSIIGYHISRAEEVRILLHPEQPTSREGPARSHPPFLGSGGSKPNISLNNIGSFVTSKLNKVRTLTQFYIILRYLHFLRQRI